MEIAKLYLRTADVTRKTNCGIYEINRDGGKKAYKIFSDEIELREYLRISKGKTCDSMAPVYQCPEYTEFDNLEIRKLNNEEVENYLQEQKDEE